MNPKVKIKAFTLVELTVAMFLSTLVSFAGFNIIKSVKSQLDEYVLHTETELIFSRWESNILFDFRRCDYIISMADGICLLSEENEICYFIKDEILYKSNKRNGREISLPNVAVKEFKRTFKKIEKQIGIIDKISIVFISEREKKVLHAQKEYDAMTLIKVKELNYAR